MYRPGLRFVLVLAISLRAVIPVGYMPGTLHDGRLVVLCPSNGGAAILAVLSPATEAGHHAIHQGAGHAAHATDTHSEHAATGESCPIGNAVFMAAIPADSPAHRAVVPAAQGHQASPATSPASTVQATHYDPRGPPAARRS